MKKITKKMARFAPLDDFYVQQVIEDANNGDELLAFQFSPPNVTLFVKNIGQLYPRLYILLPKI